MSIELHAPQESNDTSTRGIVDPAAGFEHFTLQRFAPTAGLRWAVDRFWTVGWDLPAGETHDQRVVPHVAVHLVFERDGATVEAINKRDFVRHLEGRSHAVGVKFHPAAFRPFLGRPVAAIAGRRLPAAQVFGPGVRDLARELATSRDRADDVRRIDAYLRGLGVEPLPRTEAMNEVVRTIEADRTITRVDQLAAVLGTTTRQLQRQFAEHVGLGPKWVIGRCRLLDAVDAATDERAVDWAAVAAELGYSDQAHLVRTFNRHVGVPPGTYARARRSAPR